MLNNQKSISNDLFQNIDQYVQYQYNGQEYNDSTLVRLLKTQNLIQLLTNKYSQERTDKDCRAIAELLKYQPYFASLLKNQKSLINISSWIQYKKIPSGQYIYKISQTADCYYILLKGQVSLSTIQKEVVIEEDQQKNQEQINTIKNMTNSTFYSSSLILSKKKNSNIQNNLTNSLTKQSSKKMNITQPSEQIKKKIVLQQRIARIVNVGQSFGDMGQSKRGMIALAMQQCHLLVIKRQFYSQISQAHLKSSNKIKYQFLQKINLFSFMYRYTLQSIIYFIEQVKMSYNNILFNQDQLVKNVYIIYKGQFKLYKKISSAKQIQSTRIKTANVQSKSMRKLYKQVTFKVIGPSQILGGNQHYSKQNHFKYTSVCKSQQGVVFKIDANKFFKKIMSPDNNLQQIMQYFQNSINKNNKQLDFFQKKQQNNSLFIQYLHTPTNKIKRSVTQSSQHKQYQYKQQEMRKLSFSNQNFFEKMNQTVKHQTKQTRLSINRKKIVTQTFKPYIPSRIKDIVQMVQHEKNYHKIRNSKQKNITLFQFNISKVPLHVKKKYQALFGKSKKQ